MRYSPVMSDSGPSDFVVEPPPPGRTGAILRFPFDRTAIARLRTAFPRARFREDEAGGGSWFVPGKTAAARLARWIDAEREHRDPHGEARGRDAFVFEPIDSPYLTTDARGFVIRTPYSRRVVLTLRGIAAARWDPAERAWRVPWHAAEALTDAWPAIEAALAEGDAPSPPDPDKRARRLAVPGDDLPPLGDDALPVGSPHGIVVAEDVVSPRSKPPPAGCAWVRWRRPLWRELRRLKPADEPDDEARERGWWEPTAAEIDAARALASAAIRRRRRFGRGDA